MCFRMNLPGILITLLSLPLAGASEVIEAGPPTGIALQEAPGLLITHCRLHTQRVYVRLDPLGCIPQTRQVPSPKDQRPASKDPGRGYDWARPADHGPHPGTTAKVSSHRDRTR